MGPELESGYVGGDSPPSSVQYRGGERWDISNHGGGFIEKFFLFFEEKSSEIAKNKNGF